MTPWFLPFPHLEHAEIITDKYLVKELEKNPGFSSAERFLCLSLEDKLLDDNNHDLSGYPKGLAKHRQDFI